MGGALRPILKAETGIFTFRPLKYRELGSDL